MRRIKNVASFSVAIPDDPTGGSWEPGEVRQVRDEDAVLFAGHALFQIKAGKATEAAQVTPDADTTAQGTDAAEDDDTGDSAAITDASDEAVTDRRDDPSGLLTGNPDGPVWGKTPTEVVEAAQAETADAATDTVKP